MQAERPGGSTGVSPFGPILEKPQMSLTKGLRARSNIDAERGAGKPVGNEDRVTETTPDTATIRL